MADIVTPVYFSNVRCIYPNLTEAFVSTKYPNSPATFGIHLFDLKNDDPALADFMKKFADLAQAQWKQNVPQVMQKINGDVSSRCFGQGNEKVDQTTFQVNPAFANTGIWINAKAKQRPQMIRPDATPAANEIEAVDLARKIYSGCRVNAVVRPWLRINNPGVSCDLIAIQFAGDDTPIEGKSNKDFSSFFQAQAPAAPAFPSFLMPQ